MKIIATSGVAKAAELELLVPDPPITLGLQIIQNGTNTGTTKDDTKSN
jgi:hypothetical protein